MVYTLFIILDEKIEKDFCTIMPSNIDGEVNLYISVKDIEKIDFKTLNYFVFNERLYEDIISYFSYGREVIRNAKRIFLLKSTGEEKNTKKDSRDLMKLIEANNLVDKRLYIEAGNLSFSDEDMELVKPFKNCKNSLISFGLTGFYNGIPEVLISKEIIDEIYRRIKQHNFSPLEQLLYAYDIIKTNFMCDPVYAKKLEELICEYSEPSYCYAFIYKGIMDKLNIKNNYTYGEFHSDRRAINVAYIKDEEYDVDGIYYFDIGSNSKQKFVNRIISNPNADIKEELINNYSSFCKTKSYMLNSGNLDLDLAFGDFDAGFMEIYDAILEKKGISDIYQLRGFFNSIAYFVGEPTVIDEFNGIKSQEELDDIRDRVEKLTTYFGKDILGEDFLEILFNVRKVEYIENKELFSLNIDTIKKCLYRSKFSFEGTNLDFPEDRVYEQEDITEIIQDTFEENFEKTVKNQNLEDRIKKLKLSLKEQNNSDNNNSK